MKHYLEIIVPEYVVKNEGFIFNLLCFEIPLTQDTHIKSDIEVRIWSRFKNGKEIFSLTQANGVLFNSLLAH